MKTAKKDPAVILTRLLYAILAIIVIIFVLPKAVSCLLPFFFAWIISIIIKPLVVFFEKIVPNKRISVLLSMLLVLGLIFLILFFVSKALVAELRTFVRMFDNTHDGIPVFIWNIIDSLPGVLKNAAMQFIEKSGMDFSQFVYPALKTALPKLGGAAVKLPAAFVFTVVFLMAIYFMSYDEKGLKDELKKILPLSGVETLRKIRKVFSLAFGGYIKAQLIIMVFVFTILLVGFLILGVELSFLLALIISVVDAIPVLGTGMVLNPMAVIYLIQGDYVRAIGFVCLYAVVLLTRNFLEPRVLSGQLGIHPIITLVSMYAGLKLIGVIGMIIGPVTALIIISLFKLERMEEQNDGNQ